MNWVRQEKRLAIYLRDGMACAYCGTGLEDGERFTLDHIKPTNRGGTNEASNLITACERCNCSKQDRSMWAFAKACAAYLDNGIKPEDIRSHVLRCTKAELPILEAKRLIARRGSAAKVMAAVRAQRQPLNGQMNKFRAPGDRI